jgi:hypothetical protein
VTEVYVEDATTGSLVVVGAAALTAVFGFGCVVARTSFRARPDGVLGR